jgi:hypothetical protein
LQLEGLVSCILFAWHYADRGSCSADPFDKLGGGASMSLLTIDLFPRDVNSLQDEKVVKFRELLENMTGAYGTSLQSFAIDHGVVVFGLDDERMTQDLLDLLTELLPAKPQIVADQAAFTKVMQELLDDAREA